MLKSVLQKHVLPCAIMQSQDVWGPSRTRLLSGGLCVLLASSFTRFANTNWNRNTLRSRIQMKWTDIKLHVKSSRSERLIGYFLAAGDSPLHLHPNRCVFSIYLSGSLQDVQTRSTKCKVKDRSMSRDERKSSKGNRHRQQLDTDHVTVVYSIWGFGKKQKLISVSDIKRLDK